MRILLVTQYFYPENFKSNDIAFELARKGHKVDVLTSIPNYPEGKFYKGYGFLSRRIEKQNGVRIFRAFQFPRGKSKKIELLLNYLSYAISGSIWAFSLTVFRKYNCVIVHQTSPITQALPGVIIKKIQRIPMYLWVLDIWPEALQSGGGINNKYIIKIIDTFVKFVYHNSDKILVSSEGFTKPISKKGNYQDKIEYFPNWSEDMSLMSRDFEIPQLPDGFIIMIAGNLGVSQDLDAVIEAAIELKNDDRIKWVLVGDGSKKKWVDEAIVNKGLQKNVFTVGRFPQEAMPAFFQKAGAMLITLNNQYEDLKLVVPARLQSYMSAGRPVLGMIDGAASELIISANCGFVVPGGDYLSLVKVITEKVLVDLDAFGKLGQNGREYFSNRFRKDKCISHLCNIIEGK